MELSKDCNSIFCQRLKELRVDAGVSQEKLGKLLSVSKMAVSHWEKGHSEPSIAQLLFLARYFGVDANYLLGYSEY